MKKISYTLLSSLITIFISSCSNPDNNNNLSQISSLGSVEVKTIKHKIVSDKQIDLSVQKIIQEQCQNLSDKESKKRGIEMFSIPSNPVGIELSYSKDKAYILNYIGTPKETNMVNIEMRALYTPKNSAYVFNYSGPLTNTKNNTSKNDFQNQMRKKNTDNFDFELITGLPPSHILDTFDRYLNTTEDVLKRNYRPQKINFSTEDALIFAVHYKGELKGFYFDSHFNRVTLGERKYADMIIGAMVDIDGTLSEQYTLVAFNPKTDIGKEPVYNFVEKDEINLIQMGEF